MQAIFIKSSVFFKRMLWPRLLVPQWIITYSTDAGKVMLYTHHKAFCTLSPLVPKFRVPKARGIYQNIAAFIKICDNRIPD